MRNQSIALLKVIAILGGCIMILALALKIASPWLIAGVFAVTAVIGLWARNRTSHSNRRLDSMAFMVIL